MTEDERTVLAYVADVVNGVRDCGHILGVATPVKMVFPDIAHFATVVDALVRLDGEAMRREANAERSEASRDG